MKDLIILTGPTAVGKTELSISLAKKIGGEIISADSMQVYKHMDVGTAKIMPNEMDEIKHYLIDIMDPHEDFNICLFQKYAKEAIASIKANGHIPIIVGGTGFYIQSVLYDIDFSENHVDPDYRKQLEQLAEANGNQYLHEILWKVDDESARYIPANNVKRVIRALEFYHATGKKISDHNREQSQKKSPYNFSYFVLDDLRSKLYDQINLRVDKMVDAGLVDEVKMLKQMGLTKNNISMQGIGYKEILEYLDGNVSLEEAIDTLKQNTRHFAKRQLTWFRREKQVTWIRKGQFNYDNELILKFMIDEIHKENSIL